jgi:hypothetical protein
MHLPRKGIDITTSIGSLRGRVFAVAVLFLALGTLPAFAGPSVTNEEEQNHSTIGTFVEGIVDGWLAFFRTVRGSEESADPSSRGGLQPLTGRVGHIHDAGPVGGSQSPEDRTAHENDGGPVG